MLPEPVQAKQILEVFLYGGLSQWESLYFVEDYGRPDDPEHPDTQFYTFEDDPSRSVAGAMTACGFGPDEPLGVPFANDALGAPVQLGPFARALRQRTDLTDRMRLLVQAHDLEPHEAAIPFALTGKRLGTPSLAGLGAHVQRFHRDRGDTARRSPHAYVFSTGAQPGDNIKAALATGVHPGQARPLRIVVDNARRLATLLGRPAVGDSEERARFDALLDVYVGQYQASLQRGGAPVRSRSFEALRGAVRTVSNSDAISDLFTSDLFSPINSELCGFNSLNVPAMSYKLAAHLLTHPEEPARYVCVVDTGLVEASGGGGYDSHDLNSITTATNFNNTLEHLGSIINRPDERDPGKLNLDETLIILNTEFGRTPWAQGATGRNHHPGGYVTAMLGGPIRAAQRGVYGAIDRRGRAATYITPGENRIAALLALGIYPFSNEAFSLADVLESDDEEQAIRSVTARVLGYTL